MASMCVPALKFIGTVSLGLLTVGLATAVWRAVIPPAKPAGGHSCVWVHGPAEFLAPSTLRPAVLSGAGHAVSLQSWDTANMRRHGVSPSFRATTIPIANRCSSSQGVSYTVSTLTLPTILRLPSSTSASHALKSLTASLRLPVLTLTALASAPLLLSFALSPRSSRHPYLVYTALLAVLSTAAPSLLPAPAPAPRPHSTAAAKKPSPRARMEASYEVVGDAHSEPASEEDAESVNGEEVRSEVESLARGFVVRTGLSALAFAMGVVGIWGDGAARTVVYVS